MRIINYLSHHISAGTCELLLLGSKDPEVLASFSPFDRSHVTRKAIHIVDALQALVLKTVSGSSVTWLECCEISVEKNYNLINRARTVADWYIDLHKSKSLQFRRSDRG